MLVLLKAKADVNVQTHVAYIDGSTVALKVSLGFSLWPMHLRRITKRVLNLF